MMKIRIVMPAVKAKAFRPLYPSDINEGVCEWGGVEGAGPPLVEGSVNGGGSEWGVKQVWRDAAEITLRGKSLAPIGIGNRSSPETRLIPFAHSPSQ